MALTEGIALMSSQYAYEGNGPFDAKMLVATFSELVNPDTWKNLAGDNLAYNGMIVSVWRERNENANKNGIYFLHDGTTSRRPDVTNEANWHRLDKDTDVSEILSKLGDIAEDTTLVEMISNALQAAKDYTDSKDISGTVNEISADLVDVKANIQTTSDSIADLTDRLTAAETNITSNTETIANLLNSTDSFASDVAALIGDDRDTDTGKAKSIRDIAADEINLLIKTAAPAEGEAIEDIAQLVACVNKNSGDIASLIETASTIAVATDSTVGGIKSSTGANAVQVEEDGMATVPTVSVSTLTQVKGDLLILDGGDAIA